MLGWSLISGPGRVLLASTPEFRPERHPLLLAFPETAALPRVGTALTGAYLSQLTARQALRLQATL